MALRTKTREQLYQMHTYRGGRVEVIPLRGFFHTVEKVQGHGVRIPDLQITAFSALNTEQDVDASGTGRIYFVWASSGTAKAVATTSTLATIVQVKDNDVVIASFKVGSNRAAEAYYYDDIDGVGIPYATDLEVQAVAAVDGSAQPAAGDRPDVIVVWGDDAINTEDANLINTIYG
jgi:hypothetical protein